MADSDIEIHLTHAGKAHTFFFAPASILQDLGSRVEQELGIPEENQKLLISPKPGLIKPPFSSSNITVAEIAGRKITVLGSTTSQITSLNKAIASAQQPRVSPIKAAKPVKTQKPNSTYTFLRIEPLPHLKSPERSRQFLERLANDPGIRFVMNKRKWTVPLLTEMDPSEHTNVSYEGTTRTLGLNKNSGQEILLRLRTDAYDGYRDYKTIRNTLCHELTHNVFGDHDRQFWDLCHQVEREVDANDWSHGGNALSSQEFYDPGEQASSEHTWTGGAQRLGGGSAKGGNAAGGDAAASRRAAMARAAEERARKAKQPDDGQA